MILCISFILWYVAIVFVLKGVRSHHALPSAAGGEGESFKQVVSGECLTQVWQCILYAALVWTCQFAYLPSLY